MVCAQKLPVGKYKRVPVGSYCVYVNVVYGLSKLNRIQMSNSPCLPKPPKIIEKVARNISIEPVRCLFPVFTQRGTIIELAQETTF